MIAQADGIVYFLMGYFFEHKLPEEKFSGRYLAVGVLLSLAAIGLCCYMTDFRAAVTGECSESTSQVFHNSLIAIPTYTLYYCAKLLSLRGKLEKHRNIICHIGELVFGTYLLEKFLRRETLFIYEALQPIVHTLPACLIWVLLICLIGGGITWILKKVPGVKALL